VKNAQRSFEPILAEVNSPDYRPGKFAKFRDFADTWDKQVLAHQKPPRVKAAQSHLRTYIRTSLGEVRLEEFNRQSQQNFVTRLSQRASRKTVANVLGTLGSMRRTKKCRIVLALVSITHSMTILPAAFRTAIEMLSLCTSMPIYLVLIIRAFLLRSG